MYRFSELSSRAQLIACGNFIKEFRRSNAVDDMTVEHARAVLITRDESSAYDVKGNEISAEGMYLRIVPCHGEYRFYAYINGVLFVLDNWLDCTVGWVKSVNRTPFKSDGFKRVNL